MLSINRKWRFLQYTRIETILPDGTKILDHPEVEYIEPIDPNHSREQDQNQYADLMQGFKSTLIDGLLLTTLVWGFAEIRDGLHAHLERIAEYSLYAVILLYEPICVSVSCTIGQKITKIRVRKCDDVDRPIPFILSLFRFVLKVILGWLSYIFMGFSDQRRAIHDYVGGSVVISVDSRCIPIPVSSSNEADLNSNA